MAVARVPTVTICTREARKFAAIGQLASGIAHEINTPTQYIGDNLRFLLDAFRQLAALLPADAVERADAASELAYLLEEIPSAVAQSLDGVAQVSRMVGAVRQFATARVGEVAMVDLNDAIESVLTLAHNEWKYVARVERDLDPALPLVPCAEAELRQVILSLVLDAARAITAAQPSGASADALGTIVVTTQLDDDCVTLRLSDTGVADTTGATERARALAFTREVVVDQRGTVRIASTAGQGTTVIVQFPRRADVVLERSIIAPAAGHGVGSIA